MPSCALTCLGVAFAAAGYGLRDAGGLSALHAMSAMLAMTGSMCAASVYAAAACRGAARTAARRR